MAMSTFRPAVSTWFRERFGEPTEAQRCGWPHIVAGEAFVGIDISKLCTGAIVALIKLLLEFLDPPSS